MCFTEITKAGKLPAVFQYHFFYVANLLSLSCCQDNSILIHQMIWFEDINRFTYLKNNSGLRGLISNNEFNSVIQKPLITTDVAFFRRFEPLKILWENKDWAGEFCDLFTTRLVAPLLRKDSLSFFIGVF